MRISDILRRKGDTVATVRPDASVSELLSRLATHNVGALVVSEDAVTVAGIVSERDVVRRLHVEGAGLLQHKVRDIMTADVATCAPAHAVDDLMRVMTERRIRHVPVLVDGRLAGLVSIGDIVKHRIGELEDETHQLESYIHGG
ncbi:MAG TPA: CBS domain-containing protein [Actinomadura sp.]|jgi:CBS domain-containing protein|nr:CBS domain-containing protein [Mycobacteriales bacterium]HEV7932697.1 CBS domain-containing protein [Actinomadura sp.]